MAQIIERAQGRYEAREVPFGKVYRWQPAYLALGCECGEESVLTAKSTTTTCGRCGAEFGGFVRDIEEREGRLGDRVTHSWFHDARVRVQQRLRDEASYPKGSPWRYDDVTADDDG